MFRLVAVGPEPGPERRERGREKVEPVEKPVTQLRPHLHRRQVEVEPEWPWCRPWWRRRWRRRDRRVRERVRDVRPVCHRVFAVEPDVEREQPVPRRRLLEVLVVPRQLLEVRRFAAPLQRLDRRPVERQFVPCEPWVEGPPSPPEEVKRRRVVLRPEPPDGEDPVPTVSEVHQPERLTSVEQVRRECQGIGD